MSEAMRILGQGFNPTVVRLKVQRLRSFTRNVIRFNPTVVRLKVQVRRLIHELGSEFQSHCGAIKRHVSRLQADQESVVSIPLWCD